MGICCFTGHRALPREKAEALGAALENVLVRLIQSGVTDFRAGGALGFDTFAALKVLELRERYPKISLILYLPCQNQQKNWSEYDKNVYAQILSVADETIYVSEQYFSGCMQKRNRALVDGADSCVAFCNSEKGGTAYTVKYAKDKGIRVINIAEMI